MASYNDCNIRETKELSYLINQCPPCKKTCPHNFSWPVFMCHHGLMQARLSSWIVVRVWLCAMTTRKARCDASIARVTCWLHAMATRRRLAGKLAFRRGSDGYAQWLHARGCTEYGHGLLQGRGQSAWVMVLWPCGVGRALHASMAHECTSVAHLNICAMILKTIQP